MSRRGQGTGPFDQYTGADLGRGEVIAYSPSQRAGLDVPRYCTSCGRRMAAQVTPHGWTATCPRHGTVDSIDAELR